MSPNFSSHYRSESELQLASLHLTEQQASNRRHGSQYISDDELEALCPPLGKSVMEEEDEQKLEAALRALSLLNRNTPTEHTPDVFSPYPTQECPPDNKHVNEYFSRPVYTADGSYGRASSSSSSSTPGSYYSESSSASSYGPSTPEPTSPKVATIASRRHKIVSQDLSNFRLNFNNSPSKSTRGFSPPTASRPPTGSQTGTGLLKANFEGITVPALDVEVEGPLPLIRRKRSTGFAF
ncbi:hypothetical protein P7C70_g7867, partial [Phenoliferia sp. Uapishka_3]